MCVYVGECDGVCVFCVGEVDVFECLVVGECSIEYVYGCVVI